MTTSFRMDDPKAVNPADLSMTFAEWVSTSVGLTIAFVLAITIISSGAQLALGSPLNGSALFLALAGGVIGLLIVGFKKAGIRTFHRVLPALLFPAIWAFSFGMASLFYDFSADGQHHLQQGIIDLSNDWNPFYEPARPALFRFGSTATQRPPGFSGRK